MDQEVISDSEGSVSPVLLNLHRLRNNVNRLPDSTRSSFLQDPAFSQYASYLEHLSNSSDSEDSILDLINIPSLNQEKNSDSESDPLPILHTHTTAHPPVITEEEQRADEENLQQFLEASVSSRRGLRKRNFASTFPYLFDKAQWLGLCSPSRLNYLYEDSHDIQPIIRMLNSEYLRRKQKYPNEDRFKPRNFYKIIGDSTQKPSTHETASASLEKEKSSQVEEKDFLSQTFGFEDESEMSSVNESDDDLHDGYPPELDYGTAQNDASQQPITFDFTNRESDMEGEADSSSSEDFVRVGGRYRKAKSVLRGTLPESAKRMDFYKSKRNRKLTKKPKEYRKGLAVIKSTKQRPISQVETFVDDDNYYIDDNSFYQTFSNKSPSPGPNVEVHSVLSEPSDVFSEPLEISHITVDSSSDKENFDHRKAYTNILEQGILSDVDSLSSAVEDDRINLQLASSTSKKRVKSTNSFRRTKRSRVLRPRSYERSSRGRLGKKKLSKLQPLRQNNTFYKPSKATPSTASKTSSSGKKASSNGFTKSAKSLLSNDYQFRRNPLMATTVFEAEMNQEEATRFSSKILAWESRRKSLVNDCPGEILKTIDVGKIHNIPHGQLFPTLGDSVVVTLTGVRYSFSLVDKVGSNNNAFKVLSHLRKLVFKLPGQPSDTINDEVQKGIEGILKWYLIVQETADEKILKCLHSILSDYKTLGEVAPLKYQAFFVLLHFIFMKIFEKVHLTESSKASCDRLQELATSFWSNLLSYQRDASVEEYIESYQESILCMKHILHSFWWPLINEAIWRIAPQKDNLTILYLLATTSHKKYQSWSSFYAWYRRVELGESSEGHNEFLDAVYSLHHSLDWPLEERLITQIYAVITKRKFANFTDECREPSLLELLPDQESPIETCFFDRFMHLLTYFVKNAPVDFNKKKFITKLISSSQYHYEVGKQHHVMYYNRLNLILLLSHISESDLNNPLESLISQVKSSNDIKIYERTIKSLELFYNFAAAKKKALPSRPFLLMMETVIRAFLTVAGVQSLWRRYRRIFQRITSEQEGKIFSLNLFSKLDFNALPVEIITGLVGLIFEWLCAFISSKGEVPHTDPEVIPVIEAKIFSFVNNEMKKYSAENRESIKKNLANLIEMSLKVWVRCTFLSPYCNWNIMLLQKFPYIGDQKLRDEFVLFLYCDLAFFIDLKPYVESINMLVLKSSASCAASKYLLTALKTLNKFSPILNCSNLFITSTSNGIDYYVKFNVLSNIVWNIKNDSGMSKSSKIVYFRDLLVYLDSELSRNFEDPLYLDFSQKVAAFLQRSCKDELKELNVFWNYCIKLGFQYDETQLKWATFSLKEKLSTLHRELSSCLHLKKDETAVFKKYITYDSFEIVYNLVDIYFHAHKWIYVLKALAYFSHELKESQVKITDPLFIRFLRRLACFFETAGAEEDFSVLKARSLVLDILQLSVDVLDGYKEQEIVINLVNGIETNDTDGAQEAPLSHFSFSEIDSSNSFDLPYRRPDDADANEANTVLIAKLKSFSKETPSSECLDFDI